MAQHFLVISTQDWLAREGLDRPDPNFENLIAKFQTAPLQGMAQELEAFADPRRVEDQRRQAMARIGATEQSVAAIAGLVLQIAKDVLAFRFGEKPSGLRHVRMIGSQPIVDVIWEGRNHAMHWDDPNPRKPVRALLQTLQQELQVPIVAHQNNSLAILEVLGWTDTQPVIRDLQLLVALR